MLRTALVCCALAVLCAPASLAAQLEVSGRGASLVVGGLVQTQYAASSIGDDESEFSLRRVRLRADVDVNDFLGGRLETDFAGSGRILEMYARLSFSDAFRLSFGTFKRAFDVFELSSATDVPLIERDGRIEGLDTCTGVGSICSYSRFTQALQLASRDIGLRVEGSAGRLEWLATFTNGTGINRADENDTKSLSGRVVYAINPDVRVAGQLGLHDYVGPAENEYALAFGGDLEVGTWRDGWHVQAGAVTGDNWLQLDPADQEPVTFLALQGMATYYHALGSERVEGIEPLLRLSWGDPDLDTDSDGGLLVTPGVQVYVLGRSRIGANLDIYSPQTGDGEISFKLQTTLYF
ncbi:MAG TPA: porin [Longimicrobiales bacterium]|nr:porin [Longimicrobiales bacterium]